ncbi:helix-turn-helix domain-containing protein [Georgenia sp. Z1491]|uniref:helix-turn-helix domain-containing protein n=1 Tax=Georgenia sp. Z1491 TaxID=3416707 RepID=UPI003CE70C81
MTEVREFSTTLVEPAVRNESWEAASAHLLHKISVRTPGRRPMDARIRSTRAEDSVVAEVQARSHVVGRSTGDVEHWPTGAVAIAAQLGPAAHGDGLGPHRSVATGEVMVFDADVPFRRAYDRGMHLLMWLVPREDFLTAVTATTAVSRVLEPRPGGLVDPRVATLTSTMLRGARWHDAPAELLPGGEWRPADVLEALRLCVPGAAPSLRSYFLLARHLVDRSLAEPDLGAVSVAAGIGISERYLSRVLASEGTSAPRFVTDRRLARARRDLQDPALADVSAADLGRRWGLGSPAHLSRVYKDRFGVSPREDRPRSGGYAVPRTTQPTPRAEP